MNDLIYVHEDDTIRELQTVRVEKALLKALAELSKINSDLRPQFRVTELAIKLQLNMIA